MNSLDGISSSEMPLSGMPLRLTATEMAPSQAAAGAQLLAILPELATAEEIAAPLKVTARTIHSWASAGTIPVALRQGRIVRFSPPAVAKALGL